MQTQTACGSGGGHETPVAGVENFLKLGKGKFLSADGNGQRDDISAAKISRTGFMLGAPPAALERKRQ